MLSRLTSVEFTEAMAYEQIEPDPAEVTMHLTAQLLALFHNVHSDPQKRPRPFRAADFLPGDVEAEKQSERDYAEAIMEMRSAYAERTKRQH